MFTLADLPDLRGRTAVVTGVLCVVVSKSLSAATVLAPTVMVTIAMSHSGVGVEVSQTS